MDANEREYQGQVYDTKGFQLSGRKGLWIELVNGFCFSCQILRIATSGV